jgi:putative SOS response-associated peptidase YedK
MCARIGVYLPASWLEKFFMIEEHLPDNVPENYNLGPMQDTMIVRIDPDTGRRALTMMRWGLVPPWSRTGKMDFKTINARSETVAKAAIFRDAYKARRCIVPADNYYEWKKLDDPPRPAKQPYAIARADGLPLFLAGLWETWREGEARSCAPSRCSRRRPRRARRWWSFTRACRWCSRSKTRTGGLASARAMLPR